jgi:hypothetical protein
MIPDASAWQLSWILRPVRREKIRTAEDAEGAETKTEGKRERIVIGRPFRDGSRWAAA